MKSKPSSGIRSNTGLALVEVLVALSIVAIALPALLMSIDSVTEGTSHLRDRTIAQWIASDRLTEARINRLSGQVLKGQSSGEVEMAEQHWRWTITSQETDLDTFKQLQISVARGKGEPLVTLIGILEQ